MNLRTQTDLRFRVYGRSIGVPGMRLLVGASMLMGILGGCGLLGGSDSDAPSAPAEVEASSEDGAIALKWSAVEAEDLAGYNVYRSDTAIADVESAVSITTEPVADTSYFDEDTRLQNGQTYHYVITAEDTDGNESPPSKEVQRTPFATPPRP